MELPSFLPVGVPWYARLLEVLIMFGVIVAVMMFLANDPSYDDLERGLVTGFIGWLISQFASRNAQKVTIGKMDERIEDIRKELDRGEVHDKALTDSTRSL